jgi:hypothetical protein
MPNNTSPTPRSSKKLNVWETLTREQEVETTKWKRALAIAGYTNKDENVVQLRPKNTTPALEAAMGYALVYGWDVFPADVEAKKSHLSAEFAPEHKPWGMTNDPELLRHNFLNAKWRLKCGVGVPTGWVNRIFDLEGDTKEGHGVDGLASLRELEAKHGKLPDTLMAMSPTGSEHRIYRHPGRGIWIKSSASEIAPGVDIKGDGGMFVAPPSVRSDGTYRWVNDLPIADAPQWLIDLVRGDAPRQENSSSGKKNPFELYSDEVRGKIPLDKLTFMLMKVIPNTVEKGRPHWIKVAHALKYERPGDDGLQLFLQYSRKWDGAIDQKYIDNPQLYEKSIAETWRGLKPDRITGGSLYWLADEADPNWRDKYKAAQASEVEKTAKEFIVTAKPHAFPNELSIERRDFLYGTHLLRGTVSLSAGLGATGKSSKSIAEALAMASGRPLLYVQLPKPLRVLLINLEDNRVELNRRIAAVMRHYQLTSKDVGDRLITIAKGELKLKVARQVRMGEIAPDETAIKGLTNYLRENGIDVVSIDPLRKTHRVSENDNTAMGEVIECFEEIAEAASCAIHLWHHNRKSNSGETTVDSARGAVALIDAPRSVELLETLSVDMADKLLIDPKRRRSYFRTFNGKVNFAPPIEESTWFEMVSVILDNDDNVGVVIRFELPKGKDLLTPEAIVAIKIALSEGQWREDARAGMWAGKAIGQVLKLDVETKKGAIKKILATLIETGILSIKPGKDQHRNDVLFVEVA